MAKVRATRRVAKARGDAARSEGEGDATRGEDEGDATRDEEAGGRVHVEEKGQSVDGKEKRERKDAPAASRVHERKGRGIMKKRGTTPSQLSSERGFLCTQGGIQKKIYDTGSDFFLTTS